MNKEFKLESEIVGQVQPKIEPKPDFKYLQVEVTRQQTSFVTLKVPYDYDNKLIRRGLILGEACKKTLLDSDWDDYGWELDVDCLSIKEVTEAEATIYEVFEVK